jgi:hypothetical protein
MARGGAIRVTIQALKRRFDELLIQLDELEGTTFKGPKGAQYVDDELFLGWCVKARNLLSRACGEESEHYRRFLRVEEEHLLMSTNHPRMKRLKAVFLAAKEDYEGGYLRSIRSFVHAELFDDELEQARELLASGYTVAAAIVARVVLETTLRTLCGNNGIPVKTPDGKSVKLDRMNADLAKAGAYNTMVQKLVTWLADIGNKAAHGDTAGFKDADAGDMIAQVERFVRDHT